MFKKLTISLALLLIPIFTFAQEGCQEHDFSGWAWSSNIGWISLTCENDFEIGEGVDYGLNIGADNVLSGYIWSDNIGWITFNEEDLEGCPEENQENCKAIAEGDILMGWALVIDTEVDGYYDEWISLSGEADNGDDYAVGVDLAVGRLSGYAWGDQTLGWIDFNIDTYEYGGDFPPPGATGGNYITLLGSSNWPNEFDNITFSSWIYWNGVGGQEASGLYGLATEDESTVVIFEIREDGDLYLKINNNIQEIDKAIRQEKWTHVGFTYNGNSKIVRIYVDAREAGSNTFNAGNINATELKFHAIGSSGTNKNFNGYMTRIRLYDRTFE